MYPDIDNIEKYMRAAGCSHNASLPIKDENLRRLAFPHKYNDRNSKKSIETLSCYMYDNEGSQLHTKKKC